MCDDGQLALYSTDHSSQQGFFCHCGRKENKNKISWPADVREKNRKSSVTVDILKKDTGYF